jgi:hypothetical protein
MAGVEWGEIRARLEAAAEELADLSRARLHDALEADDEGLSAQAVADERRLASARRAVLRAVAALSGGHDGEP